MSSRAIFRITAQYAINAHVLPHKVKNLRGVAANFVGNLNVVTYYFNAGRARYGPRSRSVLGRDHADQARAVLTRFPTFATTDTVRARRLARLAEVGEVLVKDESNRMGSGSFKALGGAYAVVRIVLEQAQRQYCRLVHPDELRSAPVREVTAGMTVTCASAGNHGLSVAAGAWLVGARAVVWLSDRVPDEFVRRLGTLGADVRRAGPEYADSMAAAQRAAAQDGWWLVADSSWPGYLDVATQVMRGYTILVAEAADACERTSGPATHVFVQAGVGGLAAAVAGYLRDRWGEAPKLVVVEPDGADCLLSSVRAGRSMRVEEGRTQLGRLDCGEPSQLALRLLSDCADAFITVPDATATDAARHLRADGVVTSPCGAAGAAGLLYCATEPHPRSALGLDTRSRVLLFATESPTTESGEAAHNDRPTP